MKSFHSLVDICDYRPETISLTLEDCQNLYLMITGLRVDLETAQDRLTYFEKFRDRIVKAVKKLEDSCE